MAAMIPLSLFEGAVISPPLRGRRLRGGYILRKCIGFLCLKHLSFETSEK